MSMGIPGVWNCEKLNKTLAFWKYVALADEIIDMLYDK